MGEENGFLEVEGKAWNDLMDMVGEILAIAAADSRAGKLHSRAMLRMENGALHLVRPWGGR